MDIKGLAAIVTGGGSGLGNATAKMLAANGAKVAIFDLNEETGKAAAAEIGGIFCMTNVADDASVTAALDAAEAAHGTARILVRSEEHTSELQSLMRISYAVFCMK